MKLLADLPAVDAEEPPRRPVQAMLGGAAVLVIMLGVGIALLVSGGGDGGAPAGDEAPAALAAEEEPTVDLASWTDNASAACQAAAAEHRVAWTNPDEAPVAELDAAVRTLTSSVREVPLPTAEDPRASALSVVAKGDAAEQAWDVIAGQQREEVSRSELTDATGSTQDFVTALVDVGADCDILG